MKMKQTNRFNIYRASRSLTKTGCSTGGVGGCILEGFGARFGSVWHHFLDFHRQFFRSEFGCGFYEKITFILDQSFVLK